MLPLLLLLLLLLVGLLLYIKPLTSIDLGINFIAVASSLNYFYWLTGDIESAWSHAVSRAVTDHSTSGVQLTASQQCVLSTAALYVCLRH